MDLTSRTNTAWYSPGRDGGLPDSSGHCKRSPDLSNPSSRKLKKTDASHNCWLKLMLILEAGDVDLAEERYQEVLRSRPDDEHALQSLEEITNQREIEALYQKAVALDEAGDYNAALDAYHELSASAPRYSDIERRIKDHRR